MIPISSAIPRGLYWSKSPHQRGFQLTSQGEVVGSLQKTNFWATEFRAESAHGSWKFRRTGCFRTGTEIVDANSNAQIAIFKPQWSGGVKLAFSDGMTFRLTCKGFWRPVWTVWAESGQAILQLHTREKAVELPGTAPVAEDRLTLLAIFVWHIMRQAAEEAASTAALSVATS